MQISEREREAREGEERERKWLPFVLHSDDLSQLRLGGRKSHQRSYFRTITSRQSCRRATGFLPLPRGKMLPTVSKGRQPSTSRSNSMFFQYFRRIIKWRQMDIEYTFWQMLHLCTSPKVVYQHTKYHKQTKNQWARDDPAFVVISILLLIVATSAYCSAFLANTYLREETLNSHVVEQKVEWLYAFDVHCNSFFPMFILLYVIQYFISPLLVAHGFIPVLLSNLLFMVAFCYYHYLNFLGYDVLPFLDKTTFFLYSIGVIIILSPLMILSGFNPTRYILSFYFS